MASVNDFQLFDKDFLFLKEMKDILAEQLVRINDNRDDPTFSDPELKKGVHTETDDRREVRIVLPGGFQALWDHFSTDEKLRPDFNSQNGTATEQTRQDNSEICFVGFIGTADEESLKDEELCRDMNQMDVVLIRDLSDIDGLLAYVTGQRDRNGNYGNLVLFRDKGVVQDLTKSRNHGHAVTALSPRYYTDIRIHSGRLPKGLRSPFFVLQKTLFLNFTLPPGDPLRRRVQLWRASREDSDVIKVLPPTAAINNLP